MSRVLVVATSRKTRGGITSVVKAHETGEQWKKYHCRWIETHRDGPAWRKVWYFLTAMMEYIILLPFYDIVHIHVGLKSSVKRKLYFAYLGKILVRKIIIHFHPSTEKHLFDNRYSSDIKRLFELSDRLILLTSQWKNWINEAFPNNDYKMTVL
jgi:glycosyltransferase involved in cell wall biosynthesis